MSEHDRRLRPRLGGATAAEEFAAAEAACASSQSQDNTNRDSTIRQVATYEFPLLFMIITDFCVLTCTAAAATSINPGVATGAEGSEEGAAGRAAAEAVDAGSTRTDATAAAGTA
jgi:hypothetical protein